MATISLLGLTYDEIQCILAPLGFSSAQALAVAKSVYRKRISDFSEIEGISGILKNSLRTHAVTGLFPPESSGESSDGSIKYIFRNADGLVYETVFIPDSRRVTVCVSSQSGCRMGCTFCATSGLGYRGNLNAGEIINQVLSLPGADKVTNVVFMGMGEPMDNIEEVLKACLIMTADYGLALGRRNITVSTVGISSAVREFLEKSGCNLTLSLHSPFQEERGTVIPVAKRYPFSEMLDLMKEQVTLRGRRMSVAYVMIAGINDTERHLAGLVELLRGSAVRVNILPYHNTGRDEYVSSSPEKMLYFKHRLVTSGISASVRQSRGADINAACGLLAAGINRAL
ncbi:MAG: 23S rRNA (adenine(2503)-C(2))-methyltransferase RlmN [Bacteroidales bacterium]|nr:23S rRNA (adenine(2503)-C(2))-methyltransferase RlmN [Bacteroidales bacterium]